MHSNKFNQGKYNEAIKAFDRAIELDLCARKLNVSSVLDYNESQ